jgi:hypothetical protein
MTTAERANLAIREAGVAVPGIDDYVEGCG